MTMAGTRGVEKITSRGDKRHDWRRAHPKHAISEERMTRKALLVVALLCIFVGPAQADLIGLGPGTLGGQGLGSVLTVLTMTSPGDSTTESACVAGGVGGVTVTTAAACPGAGPNGGTAFTGGNNIAINVA